MRFVHNLKIIQVLNSLVCIKNETNLLVDAEAIGLIAWLRFFVFILLITIWYNVFQCLDDHNKVF